MGDKVTLPESLPCASCGHNLTEAVVIVRRGATARTSFGRAYWGLMEEHETSTDEGADTTVECPFCDTRVTKEQSQVLRRFGVK